MGGLISFNCDESGLEWNLAIVKVQLVRDSVDDQLATDKEDR